jgi:cell division protein FtsB
VKKLYVVLVLLLFILGARLLSSEGGLSEFFALKEQLKKQESILSEQRLINAELANEVKSLQNNPNAIESIARERLGMLKKDERFIQVYEVKPHEQSLRSD